VIAAEFGGIASLDIRDAPQPFDDINSDNPDDPTGTADFQEEN